MLKVLSGYDVFAACVASKIKLNVAHSLLWRRNRLPATHQTPDQCRSKNLAPTKQFTHASTIFLHRCSWHLLSWLWCSAAAEVLIADSLLHSKTHFTLLNQKFPSLLRAREELSHSLTANRSVRRRDLPVIQRERLNVTLIWILDTILDSRFIGFIFLFIVLWF